MSLIIIGFTIINRIFIVLYSRFQGCFKSLEVQKRALGLVVFECDKQLLPLSIDLLYISYKGFFGTHPIHHHGVVDREGRKLGTLIGKE